jgi:hypothetical protein
MELFYFDVGIVSIYAGREASPEWGVRRQGWSTEVWAGRSYVCASFSRHYTRRAARKLIVGATCFFLGWSIEPPALATIEPLPLVQHTQTTHVHSIDPSLSI